MRRSLRKKAKRTSIIGGEYRDKERIKHINVLIEYFGNIGKAEKKSKKSFLRGTWDQIMDLISDLMHEPYIDDQFEIEEI